MTPARHRCRKSLPQGELVDQSVARKGTAQARLKGQDLSMPCLLMWEGVVRPDGLGLNSGTALTNNEHQPLQQEEMPDVEHR
jgi:hypothetical protein